MPSPQIDVVKCLLSGAICCTVLITHAPAQKLEWINVGPPPARTSASMVYDPAMGATLLYGGNTYNILYGDTWTFAKTTGWTQLIPAVSPPPLQGASLAYDATTQTVVLFGGGL